LYTALETRYTPASLLILSRAIPATLAAAIPAAYKLSVSKPFAVAALAREMRLKVALGRAVSLAQWDSVRRGLFFRQSGSIWDRRGEGGMGVKPGFNKLSEIIVRSS